ncbi:transporter substrate-binding domain-containing protein [Acuticoccus mangrovi]|uniref:Transporter substrate-binding domain-containing protein n=1 Tax=Acuticoccus mangrovi TaxID=2796142 RepID=A0A934ILD9_9HYPH|nr:transporter substrate-binding domain-containing protein [Acuticoccus mangrovi]MBJ3777106.1 transporter substrate-binding domain-containing protein [Acuticoccus mangrovi]
MNTFFKKYASATALALGLVAAALPSLSTDAAAQGPGESTLDVVKERGTLIAGARNDFPPAGYIDRNGEWVGFEIDFAKYIADKLGVKLELIPVTSRTRIPMLVNGNVDMIIAVMNPTVERGKVIDFTDPYFLGGQALLVEKGSGINSIADVGGKKVGTVQGSNDAKGVLAFQPDAELVYFQEYPQALLALKQGRIDAMSTTDLTLRKFADADDSLVLVGPPFKPDPWVLGVRHDDSEWRLFLQKTIMDAWSDGTIRDLYAKHMGGTINFEIPVWPEYYSK